MSPDVLVVGAGPAGSVAALVLARAGVRVQVIDRAVFPRPKLCGDTVNPGTLAIADRLGLGGTIRARARPITGMLVTGPGGATIAADYPDNLCGAAIERRDLDLALLDAAVTAGVDFLPAVRAVAPLLDARGSRVAGVRVGHGCRECDMHARLVIAAEGRSSRVAAALGLIRFAASPKRWAFGAYFTDVGRITSRGEMHIRGDGYIGVAPLGGGLTNVCVVRELRELRVGRGFTPHQAGRKGPPHERMDLAEVTIAQAIDADSLLRDRFADARRASTVTSLGPLAVEATAAGCPGLLLAGDAAGFIDPMTGDGLRFALRGGELAAEAALVELERGAPAHASLRAGRAREFAGKLRLNRALRSLVGWPRGVGLAAALASRWGVPVRFLIEVAGDLDIARRARLYAAPGGPQPPHRAGAAGAPG